MKKVMTVVLVVCIILMVFSGCTDMPARKEKISIVCTIFPVYDWVYEILGDNTEKFEIKMIGKNGIDLHSYQPTVQDIALISECDLFVYVGGTSDAWAEEVIKNNPIIDVKAIKLLDVLGEDVKIKAVGHDHNDYTHNHSDEYDEHIWLSLKNAALITNILASELATNIDLKNAETYRTNASVYVDKLYALDNEYKEAVKQSDDKTIIVADRFPFMYLVRDYDIKYIAAFLGCSSDADVSFDAVVRLSEAADSLSKNTILITENSNASISKAVIDGMKNKNVNTAVINSCQAIVVSGSNYQKSYLEIMKQNLVSLKAALL